MHREFTEAGYRVFALWPIDEQGKCGCGDDECHAAGKHPRASNWQHSPEWSDEQLDAMEEAGHFDTGYGVLVRGLLVVDVDERNGGQASYERLTKDVPEIAGAGLVVRTGSGGNSKHLYFALDPDQPIPMVQHLNEYPGIDFKSSGFVVGPGSLHKSGNRYEPLVGTPDEISDPPAALVDMLRKPDRHRASVNGTSVDVSDDDLYSMLYAINPDCDHEKWVRCGMAIHHATGGAGFDIWDRWSAQGEKYPGVDIVSRRWHSFGKASNPVTLGTLTHYAEEAGWQWPVTFDSSDVHFDVPPAPVDDTMTTEGVDLLRPPGFVGRIAEWINARNRHPRESLSVAAALGTISSVAGMRYVDPLDRITPNIFLFGVSGSATGKESILKSHQELLRTAGLSAAVHGGFKSEQEIYRNLVRNQAAFYVMDELGEQLKKISNARSKGTAAYLEGIIGTVMSLYSKADSFALITGDLKEDVREGMQKELAKLTKKLDENTARESDEVRHAILSRQIATIDQGLERPYLGIFGLTTPERFDEIMDFDMASNGFLGRSIIFRELDDNPKSKPRHKLKKGDVPDDMAAVLQQLYAPGYSETPERVERIGQPVEIPTRPDAEEMLDRVEREFWEMAERAKESTGLTAIPRRGYEQVAKVSMILAIPEGLRTVEHVRWAYALVSRDVQDKMMLANSNSAHEKTDALASKIMSLMTGDHGETIGRIRNKCRSYRKEDVDACVGKLVEANHLEEVEVKPEKGRATKKYFAK